MNMHALNHLHVLCSFLLTIHWKYLAGENFWQTVQVKAIGEEKFGKKASQCICQIQYWCACEYWRFGK